MKKAFSVLFMVLSLLVIFQQAITIIHFKLNQDAIEQAFCINKDKPWLQCHGMCHLKKQLKEPESSETPSIPPYPKIDLFIVSATLFRIKKLPTEAQNKTPLDKRIFYKEPCLEVWVPPPIA